MRADDLSEDALLGGAITLRQPRTGYRVSSDAVLLAALTPVRPGQRVLDLGTGYGQVGLCLLAREPALHVTGLELLPDVAALARDNAHRNGVADRFEVRCGSVADLTLAPVDVIVCNPPYRLADRHTASTNRIKEAATIESSDVPLLIWMQAAARVLMPEGVVVLIHDVAREADVIRALTIAGLDRMALQPLLPRAGMVPKRLVVRAQRGGNAQGPVRLPGLVLHEEDGRWCANVNAALRQPVALPWGVTASE